jgi:hypothetical protein
VAKPAAASILEALLERHGQTYAQELGIDVAKGPPSPLFRLLVASILFSASSVPVRRSRRPALSPMRAGPSPKGSPPPLGGSGCGC